MAQTSHHPIAARSAAKYAVRRFRRPIADMKLQVHGRPQMVYLKFSNLEVDFWVHPGKLGGSEPSLCLFHSSTQIGAPILDALKELQGETCPAQRVITFAESSREQALTNLQLRLVPPQQDLRVMNIRHAADTATIEMTNDGLTLLIDAVASWLAGVEDFGVSPQHATLKTKEFGRLDRVSGELWFWGPGYAGP